MQYKSIALSEVPDDLIQIIDRAIRGDETFCPALKRNEKFMGVVSSIHLFCNAYRIGLEGGEMRIPEDNAQDSILYWY